MTLQEILKAQGVTDEQITNVINAMKENKIYTAGEENLDIRYGKLKTDFDSLTAQHSESTKLIEEMKKANKGNEELQAKITNYETQVATLQTQLKEEKTNAAIKLAVLEAKAKDIDYITFKLKEGGEVELDENGKIKGIDDKLAGLKTKYPDHFESKTDKIIDENKLKLRTDEKTEPTSLTDALKSHYENK